MRDKKKLKFLIYLKPTVIIIENKISKKIKVLLIEQLYCILVQSSFDYYLPLNIYRSVNKMNLDEAQHQEQQIAQTVKVAAEDSDEKKELEPIHEFKWYLKPEVTYKIMSTNW